MALLEEKLRKVKQKADTDKFEKELYRKNLTF